MLPAGISLNVADNAGPGAAVRPSGTKAIRARVTDKNERKCAMKENDVFMRGTEGQTLPMRGTTTPEKNPCCAVLDRQFCDEPELASSRRRRKRIDKELRWSFAPLSGKGP